ncbi:MAG: GNAT family N-acetyltransferase [Bdellovibrionales bacterium]|nr:GNAT family N-acetyltransferase [Oligoflexia bacterium]
MNSLETKRLLLRAFSMEDAPFILEILNDESFIRNIADRGVRDEEAARIYLTRGPLHSYQEHGFGMYLVVEKQNGAPLGMCGLVKRSGLDDIDIGFAFLPPHWGKGYALEAAQAVLAEAKNTLRLKRLVGITHPANQSSIRVLEKLGMKLEGTVTLPGEVREILLYGMDLSSK